MPRASSREPASVWPWFRGSFSAMEEECGPKERRTRALRFTLHCQAASKQTTAKRQVKRRRIPSESIPTMMRFILICAGGAIGTGARYLVSMGTAALFGTSFPYGTLAVNLIGSFLMGILLHINPTGEFLSPAARLVLTAGVMGGFTTYSSFNAETLQFLQDGDVQRGILNAIAMLSSCLIAGWVGIAMAGRFFAR